MSVAEETPAAETPAEPAVNQSTIPEGTADEDIVKPVALAHELKIRPQVMYGYIRNSDLPSHKDKDGKIVLLRSEFNEWEKRKAERKAQREANKAEKDAKAAAKATEGSGTTEAAAPASAEAPEEFA